MKKAVTLSADFYIKNRQKLFSQMRDNSMAVLFAGSAPRATGDNFYPFSPNRNFLYITGITAPKAVYLAFKYSGKTEETLFIEGSDPLKEKWLGKTITAEEATLASGIKSIALLSQMEDTINAAPAAKKTEFIYLDLDCADGRPEAHIPLMFYERFRKSYPAIQPADCGKIIEQMRSVKADGEIECIKNAIYFTSLAFEHIINSIAPGMYEYQIESCFDFALKYNGVRERAFDSIIAGGKNACVLHYTANNCVVEDGQLVLFDFGATYNCYSADISRTVPINGKFTERQKELYNIVLGGQQAVLDKIKPGITIFELNDVLIGYYKKELKNAGLIYKRARGAVLDGLVEKFYWHKVGHALGLDTHDCAPKRDVPLEPGMVITVEPGLYAAREGIGIRIEDDILVTEKGYVNLSAGIPKTVEEIESAFSEARGK